MRFMIQLWSDEQARPDPERVAAMARYNDKLRQAGVLLAAEGLLASSRGVRISMTSGQAEVSHGPFVECAPSAGFWLIRASSQADALEWAKRCPLADGDALEVRQLYDLPDLPIPLQELTF